MEQIIIDENKVEALIQLFCSSDVPHEQESGSHSFIWAGDLESLANCYLAIVAICHQTSPVGERRLEGRINGERRYGWDYLKEKFLITALEDARWSRFEYWADLNPSDLSALYEDEIYGLTLSRVAERSYLLNNLGEKLTTQGITNLSEAFNSFDKRLTDFLSYLSQFEAYSDPVRKKSWFLMAILINECGWTTRDDIPLLSPVDYHELRGHLRIGTVIINDSRLSDKVRLGMTLTEEEDTSIRTVVQEINEQISKGVNISSSVLHYLLWNVFRNCCPRASNQTHCSMCPSECSLPAQYKSMTIYHGQCMFAPICNSANKEQKVIDAPYMGHYY